MACYDQTGETAEGDYRIGLLLMIRYKSGYKYHLEETYTLHDHVLHGLLVVTDYIIIENGFINIRKGYAWDGPSGPAIDTKNFMRGSLVHDALYQLMRHGFVDISFRKKADQLLARICREDGMTYVRAWWVYAGVRIFAGKAASGKAVRRVITAP